MAKKGTVWNHCQSRVSSDRYVVKRVLVGKKLEIQFGDKVAISEKQ